MCSRSAEAKEEKKNAFVSCYVFPLLYKPSTHKRMCCCFHFAFVRRFAQPPARLNFIRNSTAGRRRRHLQQPSPLPTLDPGLPLPLGDTDHNEDHDNNPSRLCAWVGPMEGLVVLVVAPDLLCICRVDGKGNPSLPPRFPRCLIGEGRKDDGRERETERERLRVCSHGRPPHFLTHTYLSALSLTTLSSHFHSRTLFPPAPQPYTGEKEGASPCAVPSPLLLLAPLPSCQGRRGHGDDHHHHPAHRGLLPHGPPPRSPQAGVCPPGGRCSLATAAPGAGSREHAPCEPRTGPTRQCATPSSGTGRCGRGL